MKLVCGDCGQGTYHKFNEQPICPQCFTVAIEERRREVIKQIEIIKQAQKTLTTMRSKLQKNDA